MSILSTQDRYNFKFQKCLKSPVRKVCKFLDLSVKSSSKKMIFYFFVSNQIEYIFFGYIRIGYIFFWIYPYWIYLFWIYPNFNNWIYLFWIYPYWIYLLWIHPFWIYTVISTFTISKNRYIFLDISKKRYIFFGYMWICVDICDISMDIDIRDISKKDISLGYIHGYKSSGYIRSGYIHGYIHSMGISMDI